MNPTRSRKPDNRGSVLIAVILVVVVLSVLLESIMRYSSNTHRNSVRQTRMEKAKLVAESEMEYLFYRWIAEVNLGTPSTSVAARPATTRPRLRSMRPRNCSNWPCFWAKRAPSHRLLRPRPVLLRHTVCRARR